MVCPKCGTENVSDNVFCVSCGTRLKKDISVEERKKHRVHLGLETMRVAISVFGLLILNWLLMGMSFLEDLKFTEVDFTPGEIVKTVIYLVIIVILMRYAAYLGRKWPVSFPHFYQASLFFQTILYIIALSVFYDSTLWMVNEWVVEDQAVLIYQLLLGLAAVVLLIRACIYFYRVLPRWLHWINQSMVLPEDFYDDELD